MGSILPVLSHLDPDILHSLDGKSSSSFHQQEISYHNQTGWYPLASLCHSQLLVVPVCQQWYPGLVICLFFPQQVFCIALGFSPKTESEDTRPVFLGVFRKPVRNLSAKDHPNFYAINIRFHRCKWMGKSPFPLKSVEKVHSFTVRLDRQSIHH